MGDVILTDHCWPVGAFGLGSCIWRNNRGESSAFFAVDISLIPNQDGSELPEFSLTDYQGGVEHWLWMA